MTFYNRTLVRRETGEGSRRDSQMRCGVCTMLDILARHSLIWTIRTGYGLTIITFRGIHCEHRFNESSLADYESTLGLIAVRLNREADVCAGRRRCKERLPHGRSSLTSSPIAGSNSVFSAALCRNSLRVLLMPPSSASRV